MFQNPDEQPEFPIIGRKYYAEFMFLEDKSTPPEILNLLQQGAADMSSTTASNVSTKTKLPHIHRVWFFLLKQYAWSTNA